jgi:TatA/E family protein of Tat protein translocase
MLALGISPLGWLIFLGIVLLLFGSRLPSLARSLGQSIVEFKKGMKELEDHSDEGATPKDRHL